MKHLVLSLFIFCASGIGLAGCSTSASNSPLSTTVFTTSPMTFSATSVDFSIEESVPTASVTLSKASAVDAPLVFTYSDPTIAGVSSTAVSGSSAAITLVGIASGSTTATATDGVGSQGSISLRAGPCGRPDEMTQEPVLLSPSNASTGIATGVGTLYFGIYTVAANVNDIHLHMIVGQNQAFEAGALSNATLPAGVATAPPPQSGGSTVLSYQAVTVPNLKANTSYRTQLYDNVCSPAMIAGSFTTGN